MSNAQSTQSMKIDFTTFILSISSAAFMGLGMSRETETQGDLTSPSIDLELAKQNIDLLELMTEKTRGNLSTDEERLLQQLLFETRMHFVEATKKMRGGEKR